MEPQFVSLPEIKAVGLGTRFISILSANANTTSTIPPLWHDLIHQIGNIPNKTGAATLGLVEMLPANEPKSDPAEMFYLAAAPVSSFDGTPAHFLKRNIPAGRYAKFTHVGRLNRLGETMSAIYRQWLPQSGQRLREAPHLEWYDERFDPGSETSEFDLLLPVA
ncbi:MAG TPA: GyrI-like domain-containing protein [Phycisphaerae bacterium]|nr:GyrI-like domain-containing protein [Phycisphaerae bacterium]